MRTAIDLASLVRTLAASLLILAAAVPAVAQNQAGTTTVTSQRACSASSVGNCLGCSVACPSGKAAICTAGNSHPQFGCTVTTSCRCFDPDEEASLQSWKLLTSASQAPKASRRQQ